MPVTPRAQVVVDTTYGAVAGRRTPQGFFFGGIPYAAPPVGDRRWQAPVPPDPWPSIVDATRFAARCPQPPAAGLAAAILPQEPESEDCLYCNVWTPSLDGPARPVAVWIHGGGFVSGSGAWPDGATFVRDGIVFVSFNYRLGAFGFLHLDELFDGFVGSGNLGLADQIAALRWVQQNIARFGGDPARVTIVGESAGAISVGTLLATPAARGLFQRAIAQSGAAHHARSAAGATELATSFLALLGVAPSDRAALLRLDAADLLSATVRWLSGESRAAASRLRGDDLLGGNMLFCPVVESTWLPQRAIDAVRNGHAAQVDILIGTNADEWRLVTYGFGAEAAKSMPRPDLDALAHGTGRSGEALLAAYRALHPHRDELALICDIQSDQVFVVPAERLAVAQAQHAAVYRYHFDWATPVMDGVLGACHALEIPFVFDILPSVPVLVGSHPPQTLATQMHEAWVHFVRGEAPRANGLPPWPRYDATVRATMRFGMTSDTVYDVAADRVALWPNW